MWFMAILFFAHQFMVAKAVHQCHHLWQRVLCTTLSWASLLLSALSAVRVLLQLWLLISPDQFLPILLALTGTDSPCLE